MRQFENNPIYTYHLNDEQFLYSNFFVFFRIRKALENNPNLLENYYLSAEERPDVVAYKVYGNSDLSWLVLLANNIVDPTSQWIKNNRCFQRFLKDKYLNETELNEVAYRKLDGRVTDIEANTILNNNKSPFGTKLSQQNVNSTDPLNYETITNKTFEELLNESRRVIKVIKKEYVEDFLSEIKAKLNNRKVVNYK